MMSDHDPSFSQDLLRGAEEIALYLFNNRNSRRKVYHLIASSRLPHFKLGSMICARKSVLLRWIEAQEGRHANDNAAPDLENVKTGKV